MRELCLMTSEALPALEISFDPHNATMRYNGIIGIQIQHLEFSTLSILLSMLMLLPAF